MSQIAERAAKTKWAIEFEGLAEDKDKFKSEDARIAAGTTYPALRLRRSAINEPTKTQEGYITLLFEHLDPARRSFPVVNIDNFEGREIEAQKREAGSMSAHVVIQLPKHGAYDDGMYRCVIESASPITRSRIEWFLCRQVRRLVPEWTFQVTEQKKGKPITKTYHYTPKLELLADVSRHFGAGTTAGQKLSHLVFTKRSEKQNIGGKTAIKDKDFLADVTIRVGASQGPADEKERLDWAAQLRAIYDERGYKTKIYFKSARGDVLGGSVQHHQLDSAQDLLLCPRDFIDRPDNHKSWSNDVDDKTVADMIALLRKDKVWEHTK
ncbi:hypothetical protein [Reyranella soli]|uniref:hypothetical protein n=1 Tax=Reyranella soli TaxID=1230389 RepID=UPI0011BD8FA1|nr:hypothetical protein [Reyranella soli]